MKISFNDLENIYIVAKSKSKGRVEDMQTEIEILQQGACISAAKNKVVIYENTPLLGVEVPDPETYQNLGHGATRLKEQKD